MSKSLRFEIDSKEIQNLSKRGLEIIDYAVKLTAEDLMGNLSEEAPVDHGTMQGSFNNLIKLGFARYGIRSGIEYIWYVNEGTGIYGPNKQPITPNNAEALRFRIDGNIVFAKSVKGQKPNPFIDRAINRTEKRTDDFVKRAIGKKVGG